MAADLKPPVDHPDTQWGPDHESFSRFNEELKEVLPLGRTYNLEIERIIRDIKLSNYGEMDGYPLADVLLPTSKIAFESEMRRGLITFLEEKNDRFLAERSGGIKYMFMKRGFIK